MIQLAYKIHNMDPLYIRAKDPTGYQDKVHPWYIRAKMIQLANRIKWTHCISEQKVQLAKHISLNVKSLYAWVIQLIRA